MGTFLVGHNPWWDANWEYVDGLHSESEGKIVVRDGAARREYEQQRKRERRKKRKAGSSSGESRQVRPAAVSGKRWRASPGRDHNQKASYRNLAARVLWNLSENISRADIQVASLSLGSQLRHQLQHAGIEQCLTGCMTENERSEFASFTDSMAGGSDDNDVDAYLDGIRRIATGEKSADVPSRSSRRSAEGSDPMYNALQSGGYNNNSWFELDGRAILRYGFYMLLQEEHSSTADHVGMVSNALKVSLRQHNCSAPCHR